MQPQPHLSIESMCRLAGVSRAGFYRHWRECAPRTEETELRAQVQQIVMTHRRNYGYRRVTRELRNQGWAVNPKRIARLMAEDNLLALRRRRFVVTTDSRHNLRVYFNLAARLELSSIDQLWVADITYLRLAEEFLYLAVVLDAFSRKVVGWALGERLDAGLAVAALRKALEQRRPASGLVPLRPGRAVRRARVRQPAAGKWHRPQHEPTRQPLRQRPLRELHENSQTGGDLHPAVPRPRRSSSPPRRVHRAVLQSLPPALGSELPLPGAVRAQSAPPSGSSAGTNHEFFQA
jgi:hypothetical protein